MTQQENLPQGFDDEIDLRELFSVLWDGKVWISAITAAAAAISVFVALSLPNIYESKALSQIDRNPCPSNHKRLWIG